MQRANPIVLPLQLTADAEPVQINVPASVINPSASGALPPIEVIVQGWSLNGIPEGEKALPLLRVQAGGATETFALTQDRNEARDMVLSPPFKRRFTATSASLRFALSLQGVGGVSRVAPLYSPEQIIATAPPQGEDYFASANTVVFKVGFAGLWVAVGSPIDRLFAKGLELDGSGATNRGAVVQFITRLAGPAIVDGNTEAFASFSDTQMATAYPSGTVIAAIQVAGAPSVQRVEAKGRIMRWHEYTVDAVGYPLSGQVVASGSQPLQLFYDALSGARTFSANLDPRFSNPTTATVLISLASVGD